MQVHAQDHYCSYSGPSYCWNCNVKADDYLLNLSRAGTCNVAFSSVVRIFLLVVLISFVMWNVKQAHGRDGFGMPCRESIETRAVERIPYLEGGPTGGHHQRQIVQPP